MFEIDMRFTEQNLKVFIPIVGCLIGFLIFYFIQFSDNIKQKFLNKYGNDKGYVKFILYTRYLGVISMGVLPAPAYILTFPDTSLLQLGLGFYKETLMTTLIWGFGISVVLIPLISLSVRDSKHLANYPQMRINKWTSKTLLANLISWAVYLVGYEFLFRGVLFFPLLEEIGLWPAIAVNLSLYTGSHVPYGLKITLPTIPLSIVLCLLSAQTGTIWIAFLVHLAITWTNSLTGIKYNPEMKIVKNNG